MKRLALYHIFIIIGTVFLAGGLLANESSDWEKNQKGLQYTEVVIRTHWDYAGDYKFQFTPDSLLKSHRRIIANRDFQGRMWKTLPETNVGIVDYGFDTLTPDRLSVLQATGYTLIEGKGPGTRCDVTEWKEGPGHMGVMGTAMHGLLMQVDPGVQTPGVCKNHLGREKTDYPTAIFENPPLWFVLTTADFEQLAKEGRIERDYSGSMTYSPGMNLSSVGNHLINLATDSSLKDWSFQGGLHVEIMSSPVISGPHFLALPTYTLALPDNKITLRAKTPQGWRVEKITPIGGWEHAEKIIHHYMDMPGEEPTLILTPVSPGKVSFEAEWTSPKGRHGKSPSFDVTVVQLRFDKTDVCQGVDDSEDRINFPVYGVSACVDVQKMIKVDILPKGTQLNTRVDVPAAMKVDEKEWSRYPHSMILQGLRPSNEILHAKVMIDKDDWQSAADLSVDVLKMRHIKVLPVLLNPDNPRLNTSDGSEYFSTGNDDMKQLCVVMDRMFPVPLEGKQVAGYADGDSVVYDGPGAEALKSYAQQHFKVGQEITAFFVPNISTPSGSVSGGQVVGFQRDDTVFVATDNAFPHILSHEVGHYLFSDMYVSLEGMYHTHDAHMIMYHDAGSGCEFRQKEWRKAH